LFRGLRNIDNSFRISISDLQARSVSRRKRDSIGARLMIHGPGIARNALLYGLNVDEMARWSPGSRPGSPRAA
jgi:hypothetical protein